MQEQQSFTQPLIVELLTEELPPKALKNLDKSFSSNLTETLKEKGLIGPGCSVKSFASPRRLGVFLSEVRKQAPDHPYTERLMPAKVGIDESGSMSPALIKRLESKGMGHLTLKDLTIESDGKQEQVMYHGVASGTLLTDGLQEALDNAIHKLPIPKVMRYQLSDGQDIRFVRPVHSLLAMWGDTIINVQAFGLSADRQTFGHRFMGQGHIRLLNAGQYEEMLTELGMVIASFTERRELIENMLNTEANKLGYSLGKNDDVQTLLDEVTALVEYPRVYVGEFEEAFLKVPAECLILTMRLNQKYFPLFNKDNGTLTNKFLIVSNMDIDKPTNIIEGNQRVVRPRLADAQFFYETDLATPLDDLLKALENSVYHNKLGSQLQRARRVEHNCVFLSKQLGVDPQHSQRAAQLAKADLNSNMVGEFPELQGIMGAYYAKHSGESEEVAQAIKHQYQLRINEPVNSSNINTTILFIAERLETLVGIWGIGLKPTGERDPFGLRRAALGIISAYEQLTTGGYLNVSKADQLTLKNLLLNAFNQFKDISLNPDTVEEVEQYIYERYRNQLLQKFDRSSVEAVFAVHPPMHQIVARILACSEFAQKAEATSLADSNKRVTNILRRNSVNNVVLDTSLLQEPAEQTLADTIGRLEPQVQKCMEDGNFSNALSAMSDCKEAVDGFFENVMIMVDDEAIRNNRLALLTKLHGLMNQVADISRL